jgi:tetratricopeptide (TPR) repeat protein
VLARQRGEYDKALGFYTEAVKVDPRSAAAWSSAAIVAIKMKDDAAAVEFAEKAWELDKANANYAANLAAAYHYAGRIKDRDRMHEQARRLKYNDMEGLDQIFSGKMTLRA